MFVLELLGTVSLRSDTGTIPLPAQQKRPLSLLAILALGGRHGMSRHRIESYLWSESNAARARHALDQAVYAIRRSLGGDVIIASAQELRLNPELVSADVWKLDDAIRAREWAAVVAIYKGPLLDGFPLGESRELEAWIDAERARFLAEYQRAMEFLADQAGEAGDHSQHVTWRRRLAGADPLSPGPAAKLMLALVAAGDRAGAVRHARQYQELVRQELEMEPEAEIERLARTLAQPPATAAASQSTSPKWAASELVASDKVLTPSRDSLRPLLRNERSRIAALAAVGIIAVLVIGALTEKNGQAGDSSAGIAEKRVVPGTRAPLPAARDAYLLGIKALEDRTKEGHDAAVILFRRATDLDPGYAEAYAELAEAYVRIGYFGYRPAEAMFPKAKAAALHSIALDSTLAPARTALATELIWEHDFVASEATFRKAISLDPGNATAHQWYGVLLMILGRVSESVVEEKRAADLEPLSLQIQNNYATFLNVSGDHVGALRHFQKTIGEEPDSAWVGRNPWLLANMARVYADNGKYEDAIRMIDRAVAIVPRSPRALHTLSEIYEVMGRPDLARRAFARADPLHEQYPAYRGLAYADAGNADSAFLWFDRQEKWGIQPMLSLQADRHVHPMRADPRFRALLSRLGIPSLNRH